MTAQPVELKREPAGHLTIRWNDGAQQQLPLRLLRDSCPCASCKSKESEPAAQNPLQVLTPAETLPLEISAMMPIGNYAYNIQFSDGHNTGIYTFELLRQLSD